MSRVPTVNLLPTKALLQFKQGTDSTFKLTWHPGGQAIDLTGYQAVARFSETLDDAAPLFTLSTDTGEITVDTVGNIRMTLPATVTAACTVLAGVFDVEVISPENVIRCLVDGTWEMSKEVPHG